MRMNANKKVIQKTMTERTGNVLLLKDLTNINAEARASTTSRNSLDNTVKLLTEKYGNN